MSSLSHLIAAALVLALVLEGSSTSQAQLTTDFYDSSCPYASSIIQSVIEDTFKSDIRAPARLVRLHFHDCFVDGCDGSNLLDNSETIVSEKESRANNNSLTGFDIVDRIKAALENACPGIVSCADILAIAAERSVALSGGPSWRVQLGRRDSRTANRSHADASLPSQFGTLDDLKATFRKAGLNDHVDLVALSGAHTFGRAECRAFSPRLYTFNNTNKPDSTLNPILLPKLQRLCPKGGNSSVLTNLDLTTPNTFDNKFFTNLLANKGLLQSDQELFSTPGADTIEIVNKFARNQSAFFESFVKSILRMGNLRVLTGTQGEIRLNCRRVNKDISTTSSYGGLRSSI